MTDQANEAKARAMVEAIPVGGILRSKNRMIQVVREAEQGFRTTPNGTKFTERNLVGAARFLANFKPEKLDTLITEDAEVAAEQKADDDEKVNAKLKEMKVNNATTKNETTAAKTKIEWNEIPKLEQSLAGEELSVKSGKYELGNGYVVKVNRDKEKTETYTPCFNGKAIEQKGRAHQVVRAAFGQHVYKSRRGYEVDFSGAVVTAKLDGQPVEKSAAGQKKAPAEPARYDIVVLDENDKVIEKLVDNATAAEHGGGKGLEKIARAAVAEKGKKVETRNLKSGTVYTFKPRKPKAEKPAQAENQTGQEAA